MSNLVVSGTDINSVKTGNKIGMIIEQGGKKFVKFSSFIALSRDSLEYILNLLPRSTTVNAVVAPPIAATPKTKLAVANLIGKGVCVTGTVSNLTRLEIHQKLKDIGISSMNTISTKTKLLVIASKPGQTKLDFAAANGIPTMGWEEFVTTYKV